LKKRNTAIAVSVILIATISVVAVIMLNSFVDPYLSVDSVVENPEVYDGYSVQVKGKLLAGSLDTSSSNTTFVLYGENHSMSVILTGEVPTMQDDQDIVAIGIYEAPSTILASQVLVQCPSKYET
jgi:cytochrome c-type biogenesis protein CcmE